MPELDDVLGREVAVGVKWEATGLSLQAKSRAMAGFDRLLGSLADMPAAYAEGVASKKRLRDSIKERLLLAQADVAEKALRGAATAGDGLLLDMMKREARLQTNAGAVAMEALEAIKALPAPEQATADQEGQDAESLNEDWLNQFSRYAEDASSEDLQQLWGRVLAGEVRRPGSFSRHTLRFIAELDKETAENCEFAAERVVNGIIPSSDTWKSGEGLQVAIDLQRHGLLEGIGSTGMGTTYPLNDRGHLLLAQARHAIVLFGPPEASQRIETIVLTRMGREVFSLLTAKDSTFALRELASHLSQAPFERIELGEVTLAGDQFNFFKIEELWNNAPPDGTGA